MKEKEIKQDHSFALNEDELNEVSGGGLIYMVGETTIACTFCRKLFKCATIEPVEGTICPHCGKRQRQ